MKKIVLFATAALLVTSFAFAGGDDKDCCKKKGKDKKSCCAKKEGDKKTTTTSKEVSTDVKKG